MFVSSSGSLCAFTLEGSCDWGKSLVQKGLMWSKKGAILRNKKLQYWAKNRPEEGVQLVNKGEGLDDTPVQVCSLCWKVQISWGADENNNRNRVFIDKVLCIRPKFIAPLGMFIFICNIGIYLLSPDTNSVFFRQMRKREKRNISY